MTVTGDYISDAVLVDEGGLYRLVISTDEKCRYSEVSLNGALFKETHNYLEPFDFFTHVFFVPKDVLTEKSEGGFTFMNEEADSDFFDKTGEKGETVFTVDPADALSPEELLARTDSGITETDIERHEVCDGLERITADCVDKNGAPVKWFAFIADSGKVSFCCGTPFDGTEYRDRKQTVEGEALAARANGKDVVAAVNADFFDMFGDCRPSGLCVKDGQVVANADSDRPFFGVTKSGRPVIGGGKELPVMIGELSQAVSGLPVILRDGELFECMPAEPFGSVRHPRTAVGIRPDGTVIVLVIDGRIPSYSNGASLTDTALLMKRLGAANALNLDGGGSCTFLVTDGSGGFELLNNPADLFRPTEKLIRDVFDSLLIIGNKEK